MSVKRRYFVYVCASCRTVCQPRVNICPECGGIVIKEEMKIWRLRNLQQTILYNITYCVVFLRRKGGDCLFMLCR